MTDKQPEAQRLADWLEPRAESIEHINAASLLRTQHAAIERKDALLRQAMRQMGKFSADDVCEALHHKKADRHALLAPCPVAGRFMSVLDAITKELQ